MVTNSDALEAAKVIREYCQMIPASCEGCIFVENDPEVVFFKGCLLNNPDHLPETWELNKLGSLIIDGQVC